MSEPEPLTAESPSQRPLFQFSLRSLFLLFVVLASSLAVFGAWGIVVFIVVVYLAICLNRIERLRPQEIVALIVLCIVVLALLLPPIEEARESGRRTQCANNLKDISLALKAYRQANGSFPPAYIADKNGKPMHSWRILILPYLNLGGFNKVYNFNEPWDGPNNAKLNRSFGVYVCPSDNHSSATTPFATSYVGVTGPEGEWPSAKATTNAANGSPSSAIMVVEVANSNISCFEPKDLSIDNLLAADTKFPILVPSSNHSGLRNSFFVTYEYSNGFNAAMADGSVQWLPPGSLGTKSQQWHLNWPNIAALAVWLLSVTFLLRNAVLSRTRMSV